jgi:hypothetical protein
LVPSLPPPVKALKIAAGSFSIALLLTFVLFEAFLEYCPSKDLQFLGPNQLKDRPPVLNKLAHYDQEHGNRPTIVLMGSSLAQYASTLCDFGRYGRPDLDKEFATYSRFHNLDEAMARAAGSKQARIETANLSNSGAMISEDFLILKEVCAKKNPPLAVVLEIGPRDFIDNMTPDPYRSRLSQVLAKHQEPFSWRLDRSTTENLDITAEKLSLFYSMRGELHDVLVKMACDSFHHPASIYQATLMAKLAPPPVDVPLAATKDSAAAQGQKSSGKGELKLGHIDDAVGSEAMKAYSVNEYKGRYLPVNEKKWPVEVGCLKQIIAYCHDKKLPLVIVNMPLTERNLSVLPQDFRNKYEETIKSICGTHQDSNLTFIDLRQDGRFLPGDFRDTVHMRSTGGKKLADMIAPIVVAKMARGEGQGNVQAQFASKSGPPN